ncbi:unnamed protein product, partial [Pylaiella littoralis]
GASGDAQRARDVAKFGDRPDDWINPFSLAFVLFGRPAGEQEDVDLKCKVSGGGKTGAAATAAVEPGGAGVGSAAKAHGLGRHDLANLDGAGGGAGGQQSRAAVKKERHVANSEAKRAEESKATAKFRAEALKAMTAPAQSSESSKRLALSVETLTRTAVLRQRLAEEGAEERRWTFRKGAKESHIAHLEKMGKINTEQWDRAQEELLEILSNPPAQRRRQLR